MTTQLFKRDKKKN